MRILVVNWQDRLNPQAGGAETHLHEVFGRLVGWGHDVTFLVSGFPGGAEGEILDGVAVHRVGGRLTFGLKAPWHYRRALARYGFDIMVEDLNKVPLFTPVWARTPVVLLVHHLFGRTAFQEAPFPLAAATWILERPIPWLYRGLPVVAVSESTAQDLADRGLAWKTLAILPNGVDLEKFAPDPAGSRFQDPTLLYLGRLKRYKGIDLLLRALGLLKDRGIRARLLVAGKGDHEAELRRLGRSLGIGELVEFLGYVGEEEKVNLFRKSWVHVLASPKEGWGITNLEAAACGTPTVASDSPGLRDSVRHGETGLLVAHGDVPALARALETLLLSPRMRQSMGVSARRFAEAFSWEATAREMERYLVGRVAAPGSER